MTSCVDREVELLKRMLGYAVKSGALKDHPLRGARIRSYFDDLVGTLEADPSAAREVFAASFSAVRLVPTAHAYRLEMTVAEVCAGESCGGPLFGLPQTTFRALVSSSRGSATVRVLRPKRAA